jgi:GNAT superfamily N-acetyltransferase
VIDVIGRLPPDDDALMSAVTDLVNAVYRESEQGLWRGDVPRTTVAEVTALAKAGELVADLRDDGRDLAGVVRVQQLDDTTGEFGMLAADPARHGQGIGRDLVRFAEDDSRTRGHTTMQLELLVPRGWQLASKERLHGWYTRLGYRLDRIGRIEDQYPELGPQLAGPVDYRIYSKPL